jgi:hypothetical protein
MSISRLKKIKKSIDDLIAIYDAQYVEGPRAYLEDAALSVEQAIEEYVLLCESEEEDE